MVAQSLKLGGAEPGATGLRQSWLRDLLSLVDAGTGCFNR